MTAQNLSHSVQSHEVVDVVVFTVEVVDVLVVDVDVVVDVVVVLVVVVVVHVVEFVVVVVCAPTHSFQPWTILFAMILASLYSMS